ncbi:MAG: beta-propeller fold lactonase family protein [Chloroflexi bacterium]|nr:beta-propeller fold lactonase family protein [Chloroflexota bacterium]
MYAFTAAGKLAPRVAGLKPLVYVPNENSGDVAVIDPATFTIVGRFRTGLSPEHIVPDWDLSRLYVTDMGSSRLTVIDPPAAAAARAIGVPYPYNLYFTVDGSKAIVVDDFLGARDLARNGLAFYDRKTWKLLKWLEIPRTGANHLDMSADGSFMLVSGETSGWVVKVDTRRMSVVGEVRVGGLPIDVRLSPDGRYFFVANQGEGGVNVIDARTLKVVSFIRTGTGAHGLGISRDTTKLYVTNRLAGSISVIEVATQTVTATWQVGASPDMMAFSADGSQMWVSNRYDGTIVVIDPARGIVLRTIATGANPHGLVYWPQPGRYSISTGITR